MNENRMKAVFEAIVQRDVPAGVNLWPRIAERAEKKSFVLTVRTRPALALALVLLALILLSGVAYALGRSLGYIPGIGIFDRSAPLRVLAEPVTVTREGITLSVEEVVISSDKTVLVYKVEGIPADAYADQEGNESVSGYSSSSSVNLEGTPEVSHSLLEEFERCSSEDRLLLPDGSRVPITGGGGSGWSSGFERRLELGVLPAGVHAATFTVSCIDGTAPDTLPEDWELPLHFVPAPPDTTILPVIEIKPATSDKSQAAITVERVIEKADGYILIGKFRLIGHPANVIPNGVQSNWVKFTDANGRAVEAFPASDMQFESKLDDEFFWTYELKGKQQAFPLTITFESVPAYILNETTEFEFDTGANPQVNQTWTVDQDVQLAGYDIRGILIKRTGTGYEFHFKADPDLILFSPGIKGFPPSTAGGSNDGFGRGEIYFHMEYKGEVPAGKLTIELGDVQAAIHGPWWVQWSPQDYPATR